MEMIPNCNGNHLKTVMEICQIGNGISGDSGRLAGDSGAGGPIPRFSVMEMVRNGNGNHSETVMEML